jgi:calcineurin-like phosphoesterase family protein
MANVWFISDIHGGHNTICKYRPFESEEEHFNTIKENYHKVVTKRDKVFFLGDIAFTQERLEDIGSWVGEQRVLVLGNHCTEHVHISEIVKHFDSVHSLIKYKEFWLSHAPLHPQELRGKINLHGHVHGSTIPDINYFNCCLENTNYSPISIQQIRDKIKEVANE